jgi:CrcB protein
MERFLWVCVGGAAGTAARYAIAIWAAARFGTAFPAGTAIVNLSGCFVMAFLMSVAVTAGWPDTVRIALTTGVLGGFTTYSSFNQETMRLVIDGAPPRAALYVGLTFAGGLAAGWLGLLCGRLLGGR